MIDGLLAPIFDSHVASASKVRIAGDGSGVDSNPSRRPLVTGRPVGELAELSAQERAKYTFRTGQAAQSRALGKVVDILA